MTQPATRRLAGIWTVEDLVWSLWLLVLAPASGELFLEGGRATLFLTIAAAGFAAALVTGDEQPPAARPYSLLMAAGACIIHLDVGLKQLDAAFEWRIATVILAVVLVPILWLQHKRGRAWVRIPARVRRALVWPYLMVAAEMFSGFAEALAGPSYARGIEGLGELAWMLGFAFVLVLPVVYFAFVAAPRRIAHAEDKAGFGVWTLRYAAGIGSALASVWIIEPWLG